jgi:hypothetical protein
MEKIGIAVFIQFILTWGIILLIFGGLGIGVYKCSSWAMSGNVGKDVGGFIGDVKAGAESK